MELKETYSFKITDYDSNGFHRIKSKKLFLDLIREKEMDFYNTHKPFFANTFSANSNALRLLQLGFSEKDDQIFGIESIKGELDLEMNFKIEAHSNNQTVYAIDSFIGEEKPVFLIIDNNSVDNEFTLKYVSDAGIEIDLKDLPYQNQN